MNLAHQYPIIFWNTANLIIDSGAEFIAEEEEEEVKLSEDDLEEEEEEDVAKKNTTSNYGKMASAIGRMQQRGIQVLPPDINQSRFTFTPDVETQTIRYGLKGITKVGTEVVNNIIRERPYTSFANFLNKVKINKPQIVNLIKAGAFDSLHNRLELMETYVEDISDTKNQLNLRNVQMLSTRELFPKELAFEMKVFNFNKHIRKGYDKKGKLYLDEIAQVFYRNNFNEDVLSEPDENGVVSISESYWKAIYDKYMNTVRAYIKENHDELLEKINSEIMEETYEKHAKGNLSKWSMDSVNFYQDEHELAHAKLDEWDVVDFFSLPKEPTIRNRFKTKDGHVVQMYNLNRIAGTVIDKNALKSQIILLTTGGVVTVQAYGVMAAYDKQISAVGEDGKKHVIEPSWFKRGTKIIVNGMRRGDNTFVAKKYAKDAGHHFYKILEVYEDGTCDVQEDRIELEDAE